MEKVNKVIEPDETNYVQMDDFFFQKSLSPIDDTSDQQGFGVWNEEIKAWIDLNTLKGLFFNDDWVYILLDTIASKIAAQELRVMYETYQNGVAIYEPDESHPVQDLIYQPNEHQTYYQWMYSVVVDLCLAGNALIFKPLTISELIHVPVEMVQLDFDTNGRLNFYRIIQYNTNYEMPLPREIMKLDPKFVAHIRRPNPSSALWGLSPFIPGRKSVLFNRYSTEYLNSFYLKGAQPGMVLTMDDVANEKAALRLLRSMEMAHTGRKNQRRNMILPKGVKASEFNQSLADQQLKDYIELNRETIINILKVPKHELSIADSGSLGSQEYKTALRNFWSGPLKSLMKSIEASLTKLFSKELGEGRYLEFDLTDVEFLQEDMNDKADLSIKLLQTHTLNEVRAKIFDEQPLEGGDVTPQMKPIQDFGAPRPNVNNSALSEPIQVKDEPIVQQPEPISDNDKILETNKQLLDKVKTDNPTWWDKRQKVIQKDEVARFSKLHESALDLFIEQVTKCVKVVKKELASQGIKSLNGKSFVSKDTFKKSVLKRRIRDTLQELERQWLDDTLPTLEATLNLGYDAQLVLPFNLPNRSEIEALRGTREQNRKDMLEGRITEVFSGMNQTTSDKIMRVIEEGVQNTRTLQEIADNIVTEVASPEVSNSRAMTIARTEVLTAASIGQAAAMADAAEVIPDLKKMWINAGDDRVRGNPDGLYAKSKNDHWKLGGELVGHDDVFSNGLSFPRDPQGEAGEVINCRCTFIMVPGEDAESLGIRSLQTEYDDLQDTNHAKK